MKIRGVSGQMSVLVAAFSGLAVLTAAGGSYLMYSAGKDASAREARMLGRSRELFALARAVDSGQSLSQRVLREKDPDELERLLAESKKAAENCARIVAGSGERELSEKLARLQESNEKMVGSVLRGGYAEAQRYMIEESAPRFSAMLEAISQTQERASRELEQDAEQSRKSTARA
ncbi:MAG: hypothetical protein HY821_00570, partial [Acidobacteria bacterium]|nr:hypothetical protein [Acidobacteriota bacterium]